MKKFVIEVEESERARRLHRMADLTNDRHDHDELHAAGDVVDAGLRSEYITRWLDGLEGK